MSLPLSTTLRASHSQLESCSGKSPVCLKLVGLIKNFNPPNSIPHPLDKSDLSNFHFPSLPSLSYLPLASPQSLVASLGQSACGSGRAKNTSPQRSSFSSPPESMSSYPT